MLSRSLFGQALGRLCRRVIGCLVAAAVLGAPGGWPGWVGGRGTPSVVAAEVTGPGYRLRPLAVPPGGAPGFNRLAAEVTGIRFTNRLAEGRGLTNHILLNGSGVALGDVDGDGRTDIFVAGLDGPNALLMNRGGWRFEDTTSPELAGTERDATGVVLADVDGDGDLDLLVNALGYGTACFLNDGQGRFVDVTPRAGMASTAGSMSLALADVDGDGDLDLYVANYRTSTIRDRFGLRLRMNRVDGKLMVTAVDGRPTTEPDLIGRFSVDPAGNLLENGEADVLFLNQGGGRFTAVPFTGGAFLDEDGRALTEPLYDWSLTAMFRDIDGDGRPDLYVCSDMASPDRVWLNQGAGKFRWAPKTALRKTSWFSMGVDFADLNRDGLDEIFVTDMVSREHRLRQVQVSNHKSVPSRAGVFDDRPQAPRNTLFVNQGGGLYSERAFAAGLEASEWSWAPAFLDVDLDGYEDVLVVTGFERDVQDIDVADQLEAARQSRKLSDAEALELRRKFPSLRQARLLFRNRGDMTFEETGAAWGFADVGIAQGMALADLDGDGDLDVVVNEMNGALGVYRNNTSAARLAVRLRGLAPNTRGIGARIEVFGGAVPRQSQEMQAGGRYLSSDDPVRVFAAGSATNRLRVEVHWRSGRVSRIEGVPANHLCEIDESAADSGTGTGGVASPPASPRIGRPLFEDRTDALGHRHAELDFDDFARQPLLPRKLSQAGPGVVWADVDRDGWVDLVVGTGRGGGLGIFRNDTRGGFLRVTNALTRNVSRDLTGLAYWEGAEGSRLLAGMSNYEGADGEPGSVMQLELGTATLGDAVPPSPSEPGPLALADVDGDGDLDLFVGGRGLPGRYPESADSRLFRRQGGEWIPDETNAGVFRGLGLVRGAVFSDLTGDGFPDLALAMEWGPPRVFRNDGHGGFAEVTAAVGLAGFRGWWQGVAAGDFDGDGRLDLLLSNWGTNTRYRAGPESPLHLFFGDLNGGGGVDVLEAYTDGPQHRVVPWAHFGRVRSGLPFVQTRFRNYHEFGEATVGEILGDRGSAARDLTATWLTTTLFLNRGDRFEARPLPPEAQAAPAFGVVVADFDGDGMEDVFLAQNFFATDPETDRHDGGRGLCLRGDGRGGFLPLSPGESGMQVDGEQRGAAVADYDGDGRPDLVVTQNGNRTRLFRNEAGRRGLRVRLQGPKGNPLGIGAGLRVDFGDGRGPAREVHAGSGYLSQDSAVTVLALPRPARAVEVRWPGGREQKVAVPEGATELEISAPVR